MRQNSRLAIDEDQSQFMREALAIVENSGLAFFFLPMIDKLDRAPVGDMELIAFAKDSVEQACGA